MSASTDPHEVIEALAAHEQALGDLYAAFAVKFPHAAELWHGLSVEEYGHRDVLRSLALQEGNHASFTDADRFNPADVRASSQRVREQVQVAEYSGLSLREALGEAIELERSVIEARAYAAVDGDAPNVKWALAHLREESEEHRRRLHEALSSLSKH